MQESSITDSEALEYESALEFYRQYTDVRRHDMAFITTAQGAVFTIIGKDLLAMNLSSFLLSGIAVFLLLLGLNSERRLTAYMGAHMKRAKEIENLRKMTLLSDAYAQVTRRKLLLSNTLTFPVYYALFALVWVVVWLVNIV